MLLAFTPFEGEVISDPLTMNQMVQYLQSLIAKRGSLE